LIGRYLITGASRGIGRAIAGGLAKDGNYLILHGRDKAALEDTCRAVRKAGAEAEPVLADLSERAGVEKIVEAAGSDHLLALVNNAGIALLNPVADITLEEWEQTLAINITAPFLLIQRLLPLLKTGSSVVNILSIAARSGFPGWGSYCMSKFAMEGLSQSLREELRPAGVRVINVYPSATRTGMWENMPGDWPEDKMMDPREVADAVVFALERPAATLVDNISVGNMAGKL
jgi:NAD(P)-dependent dehydrogenase (short-subunit alcohol dehydrogenase family)